MTSVNGNGIWKLKDQKSRSQCVSKLRHEMRYKINGYHTMFKDGRNTVPTNRHVLRT